MKFITKNLKYKFKYKLDETRDVEDKFNRGLNQTIEKTNGLKILFMV